MRRVPALLVALAAASAARADLPAVTWELRGVDSGGTGVQDQVRAWPDGKLRWKTHARGGACPGRAGTAEGALTPRELASLRRLAKAAIEEQGARKTAGEKAPASRSIRRLASMQDGERYLYARKRSAGPAWEAFEREIRARKSRTRIRSGVELRVRPAKGRLEAVFAHVGTEPFRLVLPREAGEAFRTSGGEALAYAGKAPPPEVVLSKAKPRFSVELAAPPKRDGRLRFRNAGVVHHARARTLAEELDPPQGVDLCATLPR